MDEQPVSDELIGTVISGRYQIKSISEVDSLGSLYEGIDLDTKATVGIRVTPDATTHKRLQEWLGQAILSSGKDAILAAGHIDAKRAYVIFAAAVLEYLPVPEMEEPQQRSAGQAKRKWKGFKLWPL